MLRIYRTCLLMRLCMQVLGDGVGPWCLSVGLMMNMSKSTDAWIHIKGENIRSKETRTRTVWGSRETPHHHSRAAGCVRAQDASLCFNSVVSLWSSSSLLGNKNILVFPPNERSGGSQMCRRGGGEGGGGGSSPLRLNWGAGRGDLQHQLLSSRRGSPQPRLSPLTPHPWPEGCGGEWGGDCEELRECKQPITTYRETFSSRFFGLAGTKPNRWCRWCSSSFSWFADMHTACVNVGVVLLSSYFGLSPLPEVIERITSAIYSSLLDDQEENTINPSGTLRGTTG